MYFGPLIDFDGVQTAEYTGSVVAAMLSDDDGDDNNDQE